MSTYMCTQVRITRDNPKTRVLTATWAFAHDDTTGYNIRWWYTRKNGTTAILGNESTVAYTPRIHVPNQEGKFPANVNGGKGYWGARSEFTMPDDATKVWFYVKPYTDKTTKVKGKEKNLWYNHTVPWSSDTKYSKWTNVDDLPTTPSAPSVSLVYRTTSKKYEFTAKIENYMDSIGTVKEGTIVEWWWVRDEKHFDDSKGKMVARACDSAKWTDPGHTYKVRCRIARPVGSSYVYSEWSDYSQVVTSVPKAISKISSLKSNSKTSVELKWSGDYNATSYDIEYATTEGKLGTEEATIKSSSTGSPYVVTGLETGHEYVFRVRAVNSTGGGEWSGTKSITLGTKPDIPTTWSSTTTAIVGESLKLYWTHNSKDGSKCRNAIIELEVNGITETKTYTYTVSEDDDEEETIKKHSVNTSALAEGATIVWRVKTAGVLTNSSNQPEYGDWSIQRTVKVYAKPTLAISVTDTRGNSIETLTSLPFYISGSTSPSTQSPLGYHVSIKSNEDYETVDNVGNFKMVSSGEEVYSKNFDTSEQLYVELSAGDISLEQNVNYTVTASASMDSGLTTPDISWPLKVAWGDSSFDVDADISINEETLIATIRPFEAVNIVTQDKDLSETGSIVFSIYRREYDGSFTEISKDTVETEITVDPHPALDYARYRIVGKSTTTGEIMYFDPDGVEVGEKAAVIQWNDVTRNFKANEAGYVRLEKEWIGTMLKLPYNLDVSESSNPDVKLVEYIGREHPVSYYGTHLGTSSSWNVDVPKDDTETLYMLRQLQRWMGDVYVREPSGIGYWANIKVSFNQKHTSLVIPVSLSITRVEGGA